MDILDVLANWALWIFDALGFNLILKKIAQAFTSKNGDDTESDTHSLINRRLPLS